MNAINDPTEQFPLTLPVKPGDWVASHNNAGYVAKVKNVVRYKDEVLVDLILFSRTGERIGRESPAMGGPRTYEPSCDYANWHRISKPEFPITLKWIPTEDGRVTGAYHHGAQQLPDRAWVRPMPRAAGGIAKTSNFNPEMEAAALRRAAQEMRDAARNPSGPSLTERAANLEQQAANLRTSMR